MYVHEFGLWCGRSHASHIFVSDAATTEEAVKMLSENGGSGPASSAGQFAPSGSVSIWRPRQVRTYSFFHSYMLVIFEELRQEINCDGE
jgi:hypothetical protein